MKNATKTCLYYKLEDEAGSEKVYEVPLRLRMVAHAMLEHWEARAESDGRVRNWAVDAHPPAGSEPVRCYECDHCGGIVDSEGFGPLDCQCLHAEWAGLPRILSAVMDLLGHTPREAASYITAAEPERIEQWLSGRGFPRGQCAQQVKRYVQGRE